MKSPRLRQLAFELLETKASPSAILLALAPLDEPDQRIIETERAMFAPAASSTTTDANAALLKFIEQNTQSGARNRSAMPAPTQAEAEAADMMMAATDTDLRTMLITENLDASSGDGEYVFSVILF